MVLQWIRVLKNDRRIYNTRNGELMILEEGLNIFIAPFIKEIPGPFNFIGIEGWPIQQRFTIDPEKIVINMTGEDKQLHTYEIDTIIHAQLDYTERDISALLSLRENNNKSLCGVIKNHIESIIYESKDTGEFIKKPTQLQRCLNQQLNIDGINDKLSRWHIKIDSIIIESCLPSSSTEEHFRKKLDIQHKYEQEQFEREGEMQSIDYQIELVKRKAILEEERIRGNPEYILKCLTDKHDTSRITKMIKDYGIDQIGELGKFVRVLRNGKCYIPDSVSHIGIVTGFN
jgi:hypothetical protein